MERLEMALWAADFVITGIGWASGGRTAALFCFLVGGLLIFLALSREDKGSPTRSRLKKWHRYGMGTFAAITIILVGFTLVRRFNDQSVTNTAAQNSQPQTQAENTVLAQSSPSAAGPPSQSATANGTNNAAANVNQTGSGNTVVVGNNNKVGNTYNTKAESLSGKLVPGHDPTPDNICGKGSNDSVLVFLGKEESHNAVLVSQFPHTVLAIGLPGINPTPVLRLERSTNGELIVDLDIRSHDGKIITRLDKDGFVVNGNNVLKMNKDPRGHYLVVIDQYGKEALNIKYINRGAISVRGVLDFPDRPPVNIGLSNMRYFCASGAGNTDIAIQ
jgi:hypothetical protein